MWKGACFSEVLGMRGVEGSMFFRSLRDERCGREHVFQKS
jgi:hypothetical protein